MSASTRKSSQLLWLIFTACSKNVDEKKQKLQKRRLDSYWFLYLHCTLSAVARIFRGQSDRPLCNSIKADQTRVRLP